MMVALFVYAYAIGVRSSRGIERHCSDDVAFRVITADQFPDHATIARFRVRHETAISELFGSGLWIESAKADEPSGSFWTRRFNKSIGSSSASGVSRNRYTAASQTTNIDNRPDRVQDVLTEDVLTEKPPDDPELRLRRWAIVHQLVSRLVVHDNDDGISVELYGPLVSEDDTSLLGIQCRRALPKSPTSGCRVSGRARASVERRSIDSVSSLAAVSPPATSPRHPPVVGTLRGL